MNEIRPGDESAEPVRTGESSPEPADASVPEERYPFWDWQDFLAFLFLAITSLVLSMVIVSWLFVLVPWRLPGKAMELLLAQFLGYALMFASLYLLLKTKYDRPFWASLRWARPMGGYGRMALYGVLLAFGVLLLGFVLQTPDIPMPMKDLLSDTLSVAAMAVFGSTMAPVCEELAFRGFLFPLLERAFGPLLSIVLTTLPFALLHGPEYAWSWRHLLMVLLAGSAFGWTRYKTGSTAAAAAVHSAYNFTFFLLYFIGRESLGKW